MSLYDARSYRVRWRRRVNPVNTTPHRAASRLGGLLAARSACLSTVTARADPLRRAGDGQRTSFIGVFREIHAETQLSVAGENERIVMKRVTTGELFKRPRTWQADQLTGEPRERTLAGFVVSGQCWQGITTASPRCQRRRESGASARPAPPMPLSGEKLSPSLIRGPRQLTTAFWIVRDRNLRNSSSRADDAESPEPAWAHRNRPPRGGRSCVKV